MNVTVASLLLATLAAATACKPADKPTRDHEQFHQTDPKPAVVVTPTAKPPPKPAELQHVTIKALGMTCEESCPLRVRYAITENPAIYELGFDPSHEAIYVSYDKTLGAPKQVTAPIIEAIQKAGFDPWLAKESWPDDAQALVAVIPR